MKKIRATFLILFIGGGLLIGSYLSNFQKPVYTITEPYQYPVTPENKAEWKKLTTIMEKKEVCQIPKSIVQNMTIEALVATVLAYPIFPPEELFTNRAQALNGYLDFNGFIELFSRKDAAPILFQMYSHTDHNEKASSPDYFKNERIKMLLARPEVWSKLNDQDLKEIHETNITLYSKEMCKQEAPALKE